MAVSTDEFDFRFESLFLSFFIKCFMIINLSCEVLRIQIFRKLLQFASGFLQSI
jgi:hypothetical protein